MFFPSSLKNTFLPHVSTIFYHFGPYFLHVLPFSMAFPQKKPFPEVRTSTSWSPVWRVPGAEFGAKNWEMWIFSDGF
jgi:hypothetical protein